VPGFGIAWQAHVGGLITGIAIAFVYLETRSRTRRPAQVVLTAAILLILLGATFVKIALSS
jgi:membrane associated rhomboid family serine protease